MRHKFFNMKLSEKEQQDLVKLSPKIKSNTDKKQVVKLGERYFYIKELG